MVTHQRKVLAVLLVMLHALGAVPWGAAAAQMSPEVNAHLSEVIMVLQSEWLYSDRIDWDVFRQRVFEEARTAQTVPETSGAIRLALTLLGDKHSYYVPAAGDTIFNPRSPTQSTGECSPTAFPPPDVPADIGYVRIQITPATPKAAIQNAIQRGDGPSVSGWIVDLRNSRGGNMWPALAGIGSLLGDGTAGFFIDASGKTEPWGYTGGRAWLDGQTVEEIEMPYGLRASSVPQVAVLTDIGVASSGEAVAIAFRGRPNTKSFGSATCGLSTAVNQFRLTNGARLAVVVSVMADREGRQYGGVVKPDELVADPAQVVTRAIAWLRERER